MMMMSRHRSLYSAGDILHRNILENDLIITDPENADAEFLIELGLAKKSASGRNAARHPQP